MIYQRNSICMNWKGARKYRRVEFQSAFGSYPGLYYTVRQPVIARRCSDHFPPATWVECIRAQKSDLAYFDGVSNSFVEEDIDYTAYLGNSSSEVALVSINFRY